MEVSVAKILRVSGLKDFILECVEINSSLIERGKNLAQERGVSENLHFYRADFNLWKAKKMKPDLKAGN